MLWFRLLLSLVLLVITSTSFSQSNWAPVFKNGSWSVIDTSLTVLYPFKFDEVKIIGSNAALAKFGNQFLILSPNSEKVLSTNYQEIIAFTQKIFKVRNNNLYGLIDDKGKEIIPCKYINIKSITKELIILQSDSGSQFFNFEKNYYSRRFDNIVYLEKGFYLLYDKGIFSIYQSVQNVYSENFSVFDYIRGPFICCIKPDGKKYLVSYNGQFENIETDSFYYNKSDRYTFYRIKNSMQVVDSIKNRKFEIDVEQINKLPQEKKKNELAEIFREDFEDLYLFVKKGKHGLMNSELTVILKPEFERINVKDSLISIFTSSKIGLARRNGKIIVPPNYNSYYAAGDYWIVLDDKSYGVVNRSGKEIIKPIYDHIELSFSNKFMVSLRGKKGLTDENNKELLPIKYSNLKEENNRLIVELNSKFGLANESGSIIVPIKYQSIEVLNNNYFEFLQQGKKGIMDVNGRILYAPLYELIKPTDNPNVFYISHLEKSTLSDNDLKDKYGIEPFIEIGKARYKMGMINTFGQILLEPGYDPNQINTDFEGNTIIVKEEQGVVVINISNQGKLIDKTRFKNYITIKKEPYKNSEINSDSLPYFWKDNNQRLDNRLIGLFHRASGRKVLEYYFKDVQTCSFNHELTLTTGPDKKHGIVSRRTGKVMLPDAYRNILEGDFTKAGVARCYKSSGFVTLIDKNAKVIESGIAFIDDYRLKYIRVNKGGKKISSADNPRQIYAIPDDLTNVNLRKVPVKKPCIYRGGKWGVMDTTGNYNIKPKYNFLQYYLKSVFIAELAGKWGVISPSDQIIIEFKYDEIRHFSDSTSKYFLNTPFYKVRIKGKWGVLDSIGNVLVPIEYDNVELILTIGRYYFKTQIDYSKTPYGLVNTKGNLVKTPEFPYIEPFKNGFARIMTGYKCYKYINSSLNIFPNDCYLDARDYQDGLAAIKSKNGWGYIDESGTTIISTQFSAVGDFHEGYAKVKMKFPPSFFGLIKGKECFAIIDKKGKLIYNTKARNCSDVSRNCVIVEKDRKFTLRNLAGKRVLPGSFLQIIDYSQYGLYVVKNNDMEFALFNVHGKLLVPFGKYKAYSTFSEGLCYVYGKQAGFIDTTGNLKYPFKCDDAKGFHEGMAAVKIDRKWGYIDTSGQVVIPPQYAEAENFQHGFAIVKTMNNKEIRINKRNQVDLLYFPTREDGYCTYNENNFQGITDKNGKMLVDPVANNIGIFSDGYASICIKKLYGLFDDKGKILLKNEIPRILVAANGLIMLMKTNEITYTK